MNRTKREMCERIGASVLIDDNWNYVHECRNIVKVPILFGIYGWNRRSNPKDYEGMYCCKNWKQVRPQCFCSLQANKKTLRQQKKERFYSMKKFALKA